MSEDHGQEHPSQWAVMRSVAEKLGCTVEALRRWVRQAERDAVHRPCLTTDELARLAFSFDGREYDLMGALRTE